MTADSGDTAVPVNTGSNSRRICKPGWLIALPALFGAMPWIPIPVKLISRQAVTCEIEKSFMECCLQLADETCQDKLIQIAGFPVRVSRNPAGEKSGPRLLASSKRWTLGKDGLKSTEFLQVEGDSEIGPLHLDFRKETIIGLENLKVSKELVRPFEKLNDYCHQLILSAGEKNAHAVVLIETGINFYLPLMIRAVAERRLQHSVERQINDFVE